MHFDQEQCYSNYYKSLCELYDIYTVRSELNEKIVYVLNVYANLFDNPGEANE